MPASVGPPVIQRRIGPDPRISTYRVAPGTFTFLVSRSAPVMLISTLLSLSTYGTSTEHDPTAGGTDTIRFIRCRLLPAPPVDHGNRAWTRSSRRATRTRRSCDHPPSPRETSPPLESLSRPSPVRRLPRPP